ncbi:MAG: V-type ATP synthase subunit I [Coriobacteriia bacterium]
MAVARMLKVSAVVHASAVADVVERLRSVGVLEITPDTNDLPAPESRADEDRLHELDVFLADAQFVVDFLRRYHVNHAPFSTFISEKIHMPADEFAVLAPDAEFMRLYRECLDASDRLASGERQRERLVSLVADLTPWQGLHLQFSRLTSTEKVTLITGTVPANEADAIRQRLRDETPVVSVEELGAVGSREAWVVLAHKSVVDEARSVLDLTSFAEVTFPDLENYPAEEIALANDAIEAIDAERETLLARAKDLAEAHYTGAVAILEALGSAHDAITVRERFGATERTVLISGWVSVKRRDALRDALAATDTHVDISFSEPTEDDRPPVELENAKLIKPFELLTDLYGRPQYHEMDPTPLLAPFFLLFFAICIGDLGYGAMLIAGFWYIKNKLDVAPGVKRFSELMMIGGAGAMVIGFMFGSYFALPYADVAKVLPVPQFLDPLADLQVFLIISVIIGMTQVFFGVLVAAYDAARRHDYSSALNDQISTILLAVMLGMAAIPDIGPWPIVLGLGISILMKGHAIEAALADRDLATRERATGGAWVALVLAWLLSLAFDGPALIGWTLLGATVAGVALSKGVRKAFVGTLGGAYAVYGMSGFLGDILSYTRLAALGLSGTLVGMVFNVLSGLVFDAAKPLFSSGVIGIIGGVIVMLLAALVFVGGHIFNVVINLLGAFVHPARLQFVEFFSKFYQGGGRVHAPFGYRTKALVLHAAGVQREGGTKS